MGNETDAAKMYTIRVIEHCPSRCGQPYMGTIDGKCFEARLNHEYNLQTGMFELEEKSGSIQSPVCGVMVGKRGGNHRDLCHAVEDYFRGIYEAQKMALKEKPEKEKRDTAVSPAYQTQYSSEPCPAR